MADGTSDDAFSSAAFYSCSDDIERLHCESPEEAIEERLDLFTTLGCDMRALIAEHSPIVVTGYARGKTHPASEYAGELAERLAERFEENYGDPDGYVDSMPPAVVDAFAAEIVPAIERAFAASKVWICDEVGARSYSAEEVTALMREYRPEWFEEE